MLTLLLFQVGSKPHNTATHYRVQNRLIGCRNRDMTPNIAIFKILFFSSSKNSGIGDISKHHKIVSNILLVEVLIRLKKEVHFVPSLLITYTSLKILMSLVYCTACQFYWFSKV